MVNYLVCVGSLNPTKVNAVNCAFKEYFPEFTIFKIEVDSGVSHQPFGMDSILKGAKNRAELSLSYLINKKQRKTNIFGIGIEAGLVKVPYTKTSYMDFQFCVILDENKTITVGSGIGFEYPQSIINEILSNQETEIGVVIGKLANNMNLKNEAGAISFLSKKVLSRTEILTQAVICALLPRINKELYKL